MLTQDQNPKPRMAAYRSDLFAEIDELNRALKTARKQKSWSLLINAALVLILLLAAIQPAHAQAFADHIDSSLACLVVFPVLLISLAIGFFALTKN